jgi:hypothetical protein
VNVQAARLFRCSTEADPTENGGDAPMGSQRPPSDDFGRHEKDGMVATP